MTDEECILKENAHQEASFAEWNEGPPMTAEEQHLRDLHDEEAEAQHLGEQINGVTECSECKEQSCVVGSAYILGYRGHPGAEVSSTYECINPTCLYCDIA